jgi:type IV pilus assembly protein PilW
MNVSRHMNSSRNSAVRIPSPVVRIPSPRAAQQGLSLVELMVAIALGLFLSWGAIQAFLSGKQTYSTQQALSRIQENARLVQEFLGFDIRSAGTYGCVSSEYVSSGPASNLVPDSDKEEFNFGNSVFATNKVSGDPSGDMDLLTPLDPAPVAGTDILVVHTGTNLGLEVAALPLPTTAQVRTNNLGLVATDILSISDCTKNIIFIPTSISVAGTVATINYAFPYAPVVGSSIMRLNTSIYYIGENAAGRPGLYRRTLDGVSEELLQGVEDMQLEFALDDVGNDGQVDEYKTADLVTAAQWESWAAGGKFDATAQNVTAVRYSLLLSSEQELLEEPQEYTYNGNAVTATDRRMYQVVNGTTGIRSRMN